ncbi:MAG: bifunctional oligoribonuclease/PAP phosphatase NrnA [Acidobacteriota bacterium]
MKKYSEVINKIKKKINFSKSIVISSHLRPDGDSIGSGLALKLMFNKLNKSADFINKDNTPFPFMNLPGADEIIIGQIPSSKYDLVILLECSEIDRSGQENISNSFIINVDHHTINGKYGNINWIDEKASALGEMIFYLAKSLRVEIDQKIATNLYGAIASDTGFFRFSNTTPESLEICSYLAKKGVNPHSVSNMLIDNNTYQRIKLQGLVLSTLNLEENGKLAHITMFKKFLDELHLKEVDTEEIISLVRSIRGVEIVLFFKEISHNNFRISIRSKGDINSGKLAENFGGGGHYHAAGFSLSGKYEDVVKCAIKEIKTRINF